MPTDLPLAVVVPRVLAHTPVWAWGLLALIVVIGVAQLRDRAVGRTRLLVVPVIRAAYSLYGAAAIFGATPAVLAAWMAGGALVLLANRLLQWPSAARALPDGAFHVPGSAWPLLAMLCVFALRYVALVSMLLYPRQAHELWFAVPLALAYGCLSGVFAARALRVLSGRAPESRLGSRLANSALS